MDNTSVRPRSRGPGPWRRFVLLLLVALLVAGLASAAILPGARAQGDAGPVQAYQGVDPEEFRREDQTEAAWTPAYLKLATGDVSATASHSVYAWPFALDSIGWNFQSYQSYGGTPYFHHGIDMMKVNGTQVYNRSGGQVINVENYQPGNVLYWEVAILDAEGYIWQYHHIDNTTIPQYIKDKFAEYKVNPTTGGFVPANTYIGNIVYWTVVSFGKRFNHIHLNILGAGGAYMNAFEFHNALADTVAPVIVGVGLLQNGAVYSGNSIQGSYSVYVRAKDLVLDTVYYIPPFEYTFSVDGGPTQTTWRFDNLPGGASDTAYLNDFFVVPPTCGDYSCRDYYIDLGFIKNSQYVFPATGGSHTILVTVRDYAGNTTSQSYTYTVIGPTPTPNPNHAPVADGQSVTTAEDTGVGITLTGSDLDGDPLTYSVASNPSHGTLSGTAPNLTYTPAANYNGPDSFTFVVNDGHVNSAAATVSISISAVNDAPVANAQAVTTELETPVAITLTGSDVDGDALTYSIVSEPSNGTLSGTAPNLTYTPAAGYLGPDAFAFKVNDGTVNSDPAAVSITVNPVNHAPVADAQSVSTNEDTALAIILTGSDPDNDPLTFAVQSQPSHGALSGTAPNLSYTPSANYNGTDSFAFLVNDGKVSSAPATVSITVNPVNDAPLANAQSVSTAQDTARAITLTGSDVEGDPLTYGIVSQPAHGTLSGTPPTVTYTPNSGYRGADSFTFKVNDGALDSAAATVSITITPAGDTVWLSLAENASLTGLGTVNDEDIVALNLGTGVYSWVFDGSDVGITTDLDAIDVLPNGHILMSFDANTSVTSVGTVADADVVEFTPTSLGATTAGTFTWKFDGSDVGLSSGTEDVDALYVMNDGTMLISTVDAFGVTGMSGQDEDIIRFTATSWGSTTAGSWSWYFDGSDVGLSSNANEDVDALWVDQTMTPYPYLYLSTLGSFSVTGLSGANEDGFIFMPTALGSTTTGTYKSTLYMDGSLFGLSSYNVDAFDVQR